MINNKENLICSKLLGSIPTKKEIIILTPSHRIFNYFLENLELRKSDLFLYNVYKDNCWWNNISIIINNSFFYRIILTPPGKGIVDVIFFLRKYIREIFVVGTYGSISDDLKIGDSMLVSRSVYQGEICNWFLTKKNSKTVTIETVDGFHCETKTKIKNSKVDGISGFDLEIAHASQIAAKLKIKLFAILFVSDFPMNLPFYSIKNKDRKQLHKSIYHLTKIIICNLDKRSNQSFFQFVSKLFWK